MSTPTPPFEMQKPNIPLIQKSLDVHNGSETTVKYLKQASTEDSEEFKNRKSNFTLAPLYQTGIESIINIIMRNPITFSDDMREDIKDMYSKDIDGLNTSLNEHAKQILRDLLLTNKNFTNVWTEPNGSRPYVSNVERLRVAYIYRDGEFKQIAIKGAYSQFKDRYNIEIKEEYKIYFGNGDVEVWRDGKLTDTLLTDYNTIPVIETTLQGNKAEFYNDKPPFLDLAKMMIRWGETDSRKNEFVNRLAIPLVVAWGMELAELAEDSTETAVTRVGDTYRVEMAGSRGWSFAINQNGQKLGDIEFRELSGANDGVLRANITDIENVVKNGFVKFVQSDKGGKTVTESENERVGAESYLSSIAQLLEDSLNEINGLFYSFYGKKETTVTGGKGYITVNKDFLATKLTDIEAQLLKDLNEASIITHETYLKQLQDGGMLKGVDVDMEIKKLESKGM